MTALSSTVNRPRAHVPPQAALPVEAEPHQRPVDRYAAAKRIARGIGVRAVVGVGAALVASSLLPKASACPDACFRSTSFDEGMVALAGATGFLFGNVVAGVFVGLGAAVTTRRIIEEIKLGCAIGGCGPFMGP